MMAVLHETGHAMYERQLPVDWRSQPVGGARGMATHESQSLLIEMQASRSAEFVGWFAPVVRDAFSGTGPAWETGNVLRHYRRVERGLIRVDADEVSYPLHVILRFDLERALFAGELEIADLPGAWNDAMERYVGVRPDDDRDGCMQDIHWMDGAFGYFPSYTLGAIAAAQFFGAACDAHPEVNEELGRGEFGTLMGWLRENIHQHGALHSTEELLVRATGRGFDPVGYLDHLRRRYLS
jgi:carboxypeptidase Taq